MLAGLLGSKAGPLHSIIYALCFVITCMWVPTLTWPETAVWVVFTNIFAGFLISGFLHRWCAHKSWSMPRWCEYVSAIASASLVMTPAVAWAALHRTHHRYADREGDPHGHMHSILHNFLIYSRSTASIRIIPKWMIRDKLYLFQARWYWEIIVATVIIAYFTGLLELWCSLVFFAYFMQVTTNLLGHTKDLKLATYNWLNVLYSGELYHEYHHKNPSKPRFGLIDFPYYLFIKWLDNDTKRSKRNSNDLGKTA